jgi:hypothetical protein
VCWKPCSSCWSLYLLREEFLSAPIHSPPSLVRCFGPSPLMVGFRPQLIVVSGLSVGIPLTVEFRPQLVVVSGLSVGIPLTVGFRPQLVVISGLSVGIPLTVGFRLSRSLWLSRSLFLETFHFLLKSRLSRSPFVNFFSLFMNLRQSQNLSRWNFGYHGAFHDGISAITQPFTMEFRLSQSLS